MANYCIYVLTVILSIVACAASFECFNCTGVTNTDSCQNKLACGENEVCFTQRQYSGQISYNLGCMESQKCGDFASLSAGVSRMKIDQGQSHPCFECCSRDGCNSNLCQSNDPAMCVDDKSIDCAFLNSLFNLCKDINQAKKVCPKYCKLCQVVDGHWTPWSNWSDCDVTCENGIQIRTRSCTDPVPQYGGLDCWGNDTETKSCHREPCPIHGGWNTWSTWSECSVSCDIGMQHRNRHCTNPRPSLFGDHCFGDSRDDRICMPGACADGGWSTWGSWGTCSKSCAGGIMSRNRVCSNPAPSMTGKQCLGNSEQASLCNQQACQEHNVAFTANFLDRSSSSETTLRFQKTYLNNGGGYSTDTGKFTCRVAGVYHFVVTLLKYYQDINMIYAFLRINSTYKLALHFDPSDDNINEVGAYMMTVAGTFHLDKNDVVDVYGIPNNFAYNYYSHFTGFLITPDH